MKNRILIPILSILIILNWSSQGSSLVEKTHQAINEYIAQNAINAFSLNDYLINNIGLKEGAKEMISGVSADGINISQTVFGWLGYGGFQEDRPGSITDYLPLVGQPTRSVNHFHNPLGGLWQYSGLNAEIGPLHYTGQSSILWAQNPNQDPGGTWSWQDARKYYYTALTGRDIDGNVVAPTKEDKDPYFAKTFRAIGQLMHLVHDASVPAHVRNQVHILFNYEKWVEKIRNQEEGTFSNFIANPISFDPSILNLLVLDPSAPIPIANIIGTDKYSGTNPDITSGTDIGIAEYANANFFSERTIFSDNFPYPARSSVEVEDREIPDPRGIKPAVMRPYHIKKRDGERGKDPEQGYRLAPAGVLYKYITTYFPIYTYLYKPALDGGVYNDYASLLLPRAVGYSAGLLEYFFRGRIEITNPVIEGFTDQGYTRVRLKARNITPASEEMPGGDGAIINLVVKFKVPSETEYLYMVTSETKGIKSIPRDEPIELEFLFAHLLQSDATDISLQVVYKGTLGLEKNNAVAVGLKGINIGIAITLPPKGVYAQTENRDQGFTRVTLLARNTTPNQEQMPDGSIELVVRYRKTFEDPFQSYPVPTEDNFSYIVVSVLDANIRSIPRDQPIELVFNLSEKPIPMNITDLSFQVVYKGKLGKVEGGVWKGELDAVAVGFKDISEPTPIDIYNDMDRICINGSWYMAGSSEALSLGNQFNFDAYPHNLRNIYLRYSPANNPQGASSTDFNLHISSLDAGDFFIREAFILSDYQFNYGYKVTLVNADPNDPYVSWFEPEVISYKGMKNQTEPGTLEQCTALNFDYPCDIRYFPDHFYSFRGRQIWEWIVFQNSPYPSSLSCPLE